MIKFFFIGFMGVGKSTCSLNIARRMHVPHVELDQAIQQFAGKDIKRIFEEDGEQVFRQLEHQALRFAISETKAVVISCGGGIVCYKPNHKLLREHGYCILLKAAPEVIFERLKNNLPPLLSVPNPMERILQLMVDRNGYYDLLADWSFDTSNYTIDQVSCAVFNHLKKLEHLCIGT